MESSETDFDLSELLIGETDEFESLNKVITIEVEDVIDEDGDDALTIRLHSEGLTPRALLLVLEFVQETALAALYDEADEDDDDY